MTDSLHQARLQPRLVSALYTEAMLLADEARAYFDEHGRNERDQLEPLQRVGFSCESLKVTTRLMHVIAWLLTQRAIDAGEISRAEARSPGRRLGHAVSSDEVVIAALPDQARTLIAASLDIYARVGRLDEEMSTGLIAASPARALQQRLANIL